MFLESIHIVLIGYFSQCREIDNFVVNNILDKSLININNVLNL